MKTKEPQKKFKNIRDKALYLLNIISVILITTMMIQQYTTGSKDNKGHLGLIEANILEIREKQLEELSSNEVLVEAISQKISDVSEQTKELEMEVEKQKEAQAEAEKQAVVVTSSPKIITKTETVVETVYLDKEKPRQILGNGFIIVDDESCASGKAQISPRMEKSCRN